MLKLNTIYNENCLDTMKKMSDEFVDLTITSPPYDNLRTYNGYSFPFKEISEELYRITKTGGVLVWIVGDATIDGSETTSSFKQAIYFKEIGFNLHDTMIYQKTGTPFPSKVRYNQTFEYMFVLSKGKPKTFNPIMKRNIMAGDFRKTAKQRGKSGSTEVKNRLTNEYGVENNVWRITNGGASSKDKIAFEHPAVFPETLVNKHILSWSNKDEIVYDCFMGSGTTAKCAHLLNRKWIGSEISKEYVDISHKRLKPHLLQKRLF